MAPVPQYPFTPRTNAPRPQLPISQYNVKLQDESGSQPVKFQIIIREGQEIVVGRIKVPTPTGHAFILRRFDTGAVSLSTMFRACYPTASEESEKAETNWVKTNYDTAGSNGGGRLRLAGTWIPPLLALHLARDYNLDHILPALANATPEAKASYRKSSKQAVGGSPPNTSGVNHDASHSAVNGIVAPALSIPTSLPPTTPKSASKVSSTTKHALKDSSPVRQPPTKRSRKSASPAPSLISKPTPTKIRSSPRRPPKVQEEEEEPEVPGPDPEQDIAEAKAEVARLKAEHLAAKAQAATDEELIPITPASKKRNVKALDTPPLQFDLDKIEQSAMELVPTRPIANPRRLQPTQKAAAWGGLVFLLGLGASAVIPGLLPGGSFGLW